MNEDAFNSYCYITDTFSLPGAKGPHPGIGPHRDEVSGKGKLTCMLLPVGTCIPRILPVDSLSAPYPVRLILHALYAEQICA